MPAAYSSREFGAESNYLMMTKPDDASWPAASSCVQHEAVLCARWFSCCGHTSIYHSHTRKQISQLAACMLCAWCARVRTIHPLLSIHVEDWPMPSSCPC